MQQHARGAAMRKQAAIKRSMRSPVANKQADWELPAEFVEPAHARLLPPLKYGQWERLHDTIEILRLEYELGDREEDKPTTEGQLRARHVVTLGLPQRTTNILEQVECFTIGALLDSFPHCLVDVPNCGPEAVKSVARALYTVGALTKEQAAGAILEWQGRMELPTESRRGLRGEK
jgi:hypothetical protein